MSELTGFFTKSSAFQLGNSRPIAGRSGVTLHVPQFQKKLSADHSHSLEQR
jgi:hypothetical protein